MFVYGSANREAIKLSLNRTYAAKIDRLRRHAEIGSKSPSDSGQSSLHSTAGEGQRVDPVVWSALMMGGPARCGRATHTRSSAGPLIVLLRRRLAFGFMRWTDLGTKRGATAEMAWNAA